MNRNEIVNRSVFVLDLFTWKELLSRTGNGNLGTHNCKATHHNHRLHGAVSDEFDIELSYVHSCHNRLKTGGIPSFERGVHYAGRRD